MAFSLINLSASADGSPIQITTTGLVTGLSAASPYVGQVIHSGIGTGSQLDEVFLYATNRAVSGLYLGIQWGNTGTGASMQMTIPSADGFTLISPGLIIGSGSIIRAYASVANNISLMGYVQRGP